MCGILGMNISDEKIAREGIDLFSYRGPDSTGVFADDEITLGFKRLAIIDLDPRSDQPMHDSDRTVTIVFNGEIYNYKALKKELSKTYTFNTDSDTEVLIYAYKKWGKSLVKYIKGMYAFCIYDHKKKIFLLFRDYSGIKPLYYYCNNGLFIFASEIKGILRILRGLGKKIEVDKNMLDFFYSVGYIPSPFSLYKHISKLSPHSFLKYDLRKNTKQIHSFETVVAKEDGLKKFYSLLEKKTMYHLNADVPVGLFFSGGTDSSILASFLKKNNIRLENFSIQMSHKKEDEKFFKNISKHLNIKSHVYKFGHQEFENVYPQVMQRIDEPFVDSSIFPTFYISEKASKKVKVVLSGEGGDEYFYGYNRHRTLYALRDHTDYKMTWLDKLYFTTPRLSLKNAIFKYLFKWNKQPISYYLANMSVGKDIVSWKRIKKEIGKRNIKPLDLDKLLYLENILLRKIDFATSYNSIEGRVPLLDIDVIINSDQFEDVKLAHGSLKYMLKKILLFHLPKKFVFRKKSGFGLNMKEAFKHSKHLGDDFLRAIDFLKPLGMLPKKFKVKNKKQYLSRYPGLCFAIIILYHCLKNTK